MNALLLLDTNIIIDYLRDDPNAAASMDNLPEAPLASNIVVGELYAGVRDGTEWRQLVQFLHGITVVSLNEAMAVQGGLYRRQYGASHGGGFNDAMIAATAAMKRAVLVTRNSRHFPMLTEVMTPC